jgi:hypothetical protein
MTPTFGFHQSSVTVVGGRCLGETEQALIVDFVDLDT